jgi:hypothetical protein
MPSSKETKLARTHLIEPLQYKNIYKGATYLRERMLGIVY